jgi:4-amino-4-deoxy-L-arabinose transferase-like glycosyltransferase
MKSLGFVLVLFVGALGVRGSVTFSFRDLDTGPVGEICNDDVQFHLLAVNLVEGYGYKVTPDRPLTSFRAPGFPFVLATFYSLFGQTPAGAYALLAMISAATCVLTYFLAREILAEKSARWAGVLAAVYLPHAYMASTFNSETAYAFWLALGLWLFVRYLKSRAIWLVIFASVALGWATLTRPGSLLMLPLLLGLLAWLDWRDKCLRPFPYVVFTLGFLGVIAPWTIRNYDVHGKWILVATNGGTTFWGGNNDRALTEPKHLGYWLPNTELPHRELILAASNEVERDEIEWRLGKDWVREHWTSMPRLEAYRFARLWWLPDYGPGLRWLRIVSYLPFLLLYAVFAIRVFWRQACWTPSWLVLHVTMATVLITALIFCGEPRFRDSIMPVLMVYAAAGICGSLSRWGIGVRHPSSPHEFALKSS